MTVSKKQIKKTNYFSHDSNARNDSKIISLRMKLGVEGYGIYFMIIERLREETDYVSNKDYDSLAFDFRTTKEKIKSVIEDFGLFIFTDDDCFYSDSLMQRMTIKDEKSKKHSLGGKKAMEKRWNNTPDTAQNNKDAITNLSNSDNIVITNLHESDNKESKGKESKGKESKERESTLSLAPNESSERGEAQPPSETPKPKTPFTSEQEELYKKFIKWSKENIPNVSKMQKPLSIDEYFKLKNSFPSQFIITLLYKMDNYKDIKKKNVSTYRTFLNWAEREEIKK